MTQPPTPTSLRNVHGEELAFSFAPPGAGGRDVVVLGHGVTSDKDRPWSEGLAAALARSGIATLRIAFSGNGESEGRFIDSTISKEVEDLRAVVDALAGWRVTYVGHSMGGAVGLLAAAGDERIRALVSLAAVTHAAEFGQRMFGHLRAGEPMLGKEHCPWGAALEADLSGWGSLAPQAREIRVPWLVVHGDADDVVPVDHSLDLAESAGDRAELVVLEGVDHSFGGDGLAQMLSVVAPWITRTLTGLE